VIFRYSPDRQSRASGVSICSPSSACCRPTATPGFDALYERTPVPLLEAACWAHVRRKFYEIHIAADSRSRAEALERIGALYQIEEESAAGCLKSVARFVRPARAAACGPAWMASETVRRLSKKAELAVAIRYALSRWAALTRYRDDGAIEIDNNGAERALRAWPLAQQLLFALRRPAGETSRGDV